MSDKKIDITSTAIEKGLDIAKDFLDKLIIPTVEETGLLLKDKVTMWRFKNQIKMINKTEEFCKKNKINPKKISLKLLCPLLDYAALEEDNVLQDKWALLLSNMVDSDQNIENHVFPYILSQVSITEFMVLETAMMMNKERIKKLNIELAHFKKEFGEKQKHLEDKNKLIEKDIKEKWEKKENPWDLQQTKWKVETELRELNKKENEILVKLREPEYIPYSELKDYEVSNLERLGLIKIIERNNAYVESHRIRNEPHSDYLYLEDAVVRIEPDYEELSFTELGKLFMIACTEKTKRT